MVEGLPKEKGASLVVQWLRMPCNERDTGSIPGPGRNQCWGAIKSGHLNYWAHTLQRGKLVHPDPVLHKRSHLSEKPTHQWRAAPLTATRERPRAATRPSRARKKMSRKGDEWNTRGWVRRSLSLPSRSQLWTNPLHLGSHVLLTWRQAARLPFSVQNFQFPWYSVSREHHSNMEFLRVHI